MHGQAPRFPFFTHFMWHPFQPSKAEQQQMKTAQFLGQKDHHISLTEGQLMPFDVTVGWGFLLPLLPLDFSEIQL